MIGLICPAVLCQIISTIITTPVITDFFQASVKNFVDICKRKQLKLVYGTNVKGGGEKKKRM